MWDYIWPVQILIPWQILPYSGLAVRSLTVYLHIVWKQYFSLQLRLWNFFTRLFQKESDKGSWDAQAEALYCWPSNLDFEPHRAQGLLWRLTFNSNNCADTGKNWSYESWLQLTLSSPIWKPAKKVLAGKGASEGGSWRTPSVPPPVSNHWGNSLDFPYPIPCLALHLSLLQQPLWLRNYFSVITEQLASFSIESSAASVFTLHLRLCCVNGQSQLPLCVHVDVLPSMHRCYG